MQRLLQHDTQVAAGLYFTVKSLNLAVQCGIIEIRPKYEWRKVFMANNELQIAGSQGELRIRPYEHHAKYYETDQMGIIHHSNYVKWMEEARLDLMDQIGLNYRQMEDMEIISPVLSISVEYHSMVHFDDTVVIYTKLLKYNGIKMELEYVMKDKETGELRTTAKSSHCFLNKSGKPISLKRMYPELDTKFFEFKEA